MSDCELVEDTAFSVAAGDHVLFSQGKDCINPTAVYLPPSLENAKELNVILWLHGHRVRTMKDVFGPAAGTSMVADDTKHDEEKGTTLRESVLASGMAVVLIAPFLGYHWTETVPDPAKPGKSKTVPHGPYTLGKMGKKNGVQAYLMEVLDKIAKWGTDSKKLKNTSLFDINKLVKLVIACHSGAGELMQAATATMDDVFRPKLTECWGFDCLYGTGMHYGVWAHGLPGTAHYFYLARGSWASCFVEFWSFVYGTRTKRNPCMHNVCLAPAVKGIEHLDDKVVFQSVDDIDRKNRDKGTKLLEYEKIRVEVDGSLDEGNASKYKVLVTKYLKEHFQVVRDVLKPRIIGLFGANPQALRVMNKAMQDAIDACEAKEKKEATKGHHKRKN